MPNIKSSIKDLKRSRKRAIRNADVRTGIKTAIKKARAATAGGDAEAARAQTQAAARLLDKAVSKGAIHKRAAARRKSRLAKRLGAAAPQTPAPPEQEPASE